MGIFSRLFGASRRKELEAYYLKLRDMTDEEMGTMVVFVTVARNMVESNPVSFGFLPGISLLAPALLYQADNECIAKMEKLIKEVQSANQHTLAAGLMAWNHTLRSVASPNLQLLARGMWQEISRGFAFAAVTAGAMGVHSIQANEYVLIPEGFHP